MHKIIACIAGTIGLVLIGTAPASAADVNTRSAADAPANSVGSVQIKDGSINQVDINPNLYTVLRTPMQDKVTSWSVKDGSLGIHDLDANLKSDITSKTGQLTSVEADGVYPGATGDYKNLQDYKAQGANSTAKWTGDSGATLQRSWVMCAPGKTVLGGGYSRADESVTAFKNLQIVTSSPTQIKLNEDGSYSEVYNPIGGDAAGSVEPNAWLVEGFNNGTTDLIVRPYMVCGNVAK